MKKIFPIVIFLQLSLSCHSSIVMQIRRMKDENKRVLPLLLPLMPIVCYLSVSMILYEVIGMSVCMFLQLKP